MSQKFLNLQIHSGKAWKFPHLLLNNLEIYKSKEKKYGNFQTFCRKFGKVQIHRRKIWNFQIYSREIWNFKSITQKCGNFQIVIEKIWIFSDLWCKKLEIFRSITQNLGNFLNYSTKICKFTDSELGLYRISGNWILSGQIWQFAGYLDNPDPFFLLDYPARYPVSSIAGLSGNCI